LDRIPITPEGFQALKLDLANLKKVERPQTIRAIEEARALGDLSENAEYHAAKERQGFIERRIRELEHKIAQADIIDPEHLPRSKAVFGSTVVLENLDTGDEVRYQLVGPDESDIGRGKISIASPIGRAILGKKPGEAVSVQAPGGIRNYEIVEIA